MLKYINASAGQQLIVINHIQNKIVYMYVFIYIINIHGTHTFLMYTKTFILY